MNSEDSSDLGESEGFDSQTDTRIHSEENHPGITQQNVNVLSFENNQNLITKVWSHARIQSILILIGIIEAILVTLLCSLQADSSSDDLQLSEVFPIYDNFTRNHFLFVAENGD